MIGRLRGQVGAIGAETALIDVRGVGYLVSASARTLTSLAAADGEVTVHVETQVREDAIQLFGFASEAERDWFRLLLSVQGVGGRVALAILSTLPPADLQLAIARGDKATIARANGVGPKLAARIVNELKDRAGAVGTAAELASPSLAPAASVAALATAGRADALSALANLGFRPAEAERAVDAAAAELGPDAAVGELLRVALRRAAK